MQIITCKKCAFILGTKPGLLEKEGVCLACINSENKKNINFIERQEWLTKFILDNRTDSEYDCVVAVSGGKDSHMIVKRLIENHGVKNPLLITVEDEFTTTSAGMHNRKNIAEYFGLNHLSFRHNPIEFKKNTLYDFEHSLNPLKWIEEQLYQLPIQVAKKYGIQLIFFGENSAFEYGSSKELDIFHPLSTNETKVIYMGAIYPYTIKDSLREAREVGFKSLDDFNEWQRTGNIENYTQIDSIGYIVHLWLKFVKFGFQRVSDIASRMVREESLTREQAEKLIIENDYILDVAAKKDFCKTINITEQYFNEIVERHANLDIVKKDINGKWRRLDLLY